MNPTFTTTTSCVTNSIPQPQHASSPNTTTDTDRLRYHHHHHHPRYTRSCNDDDNDDDHACYCSEEDWNHNHQIMHHPTTQTSSLAPTYNSLHREQQPQPQQEIQNQQQKHVSSYSPTTLATQQTTDATTKTFHTNTTTKAGCSNESSLALQPQSPFVLSKSLYPSINDIPADISVDEIFQQTNIVIGRKPASTTTTTTTTGTQTATTTSNHQPHDDIDTTKNIYPKKITPKSSGNRVYQSYDDSNHDDIVDFRNHPNVDDYDDIEDEVEEEANYQYQSNPLLRQPPPPPPEVSQQNYNPLERFDKYDVYNNPQDTTSATTSTTTSSRSTNHHYACNRESPIDYQSNNEDNNIDDETHWDLYYSKHVAQQQQQQQQQHHFPHSEIVPVILPELDDTSTSYPDNDYHHCYNNNNNNNNDDAYNTTSSIQQYRSDEIESTINRQQQQKQRKTIPTIEISPGIYLPLRGAHETMYAIECGFYVTIPCTICQQSLICIANCELVLCPICRIVSPNTATMLKHKTTTTTRNTTTTATAANTRHIMEEGNADIILHLKVKSGVGLGLQAK